MKEVLRLNEISPLVNSVFQDKYIMTKDAKEPVGILVRSFNMHEYKLAPSVLCVGRAGAGTNNIPLDRYAEEGVVVFNTPGANANAVKELVLSDMLMCGRRIAEGIAWTNGLTDGEKTVAEQVESGKKAFAGSEIKDTTLGIMGLGRLVAEAALALGMKVLAVDPYLTKEAASTLPEDVRILDNIDDMFALSDYLTFHVPLTNETRGFINRESIAKMKDGVNIINCSRGELVDNESIIQACESGKVNRYVTDFPATELLNRKNIICTPHLGASTAEAEDNCAVMAVDEIRSYFENGNIINSVNFPRLDMGELESGIRVAVMIKDVADPALSVMEMLSAAKIKYSRVMASRREDGISYVLAEITQENIPSLLFYGEEGAKIISYRAIEK